MKRNMIALALLPLALAACNEHKYHPHKERIARSHDGGYYVQDDNGAWLMYVIAAQSSNGSATTYVPYQAPLASASRTVTTPSLSSTPSTPSASSSPSSSAAVSSSVPVPAGPTASAANNSVMTAQTAAAVQTQSLPNGFWTEAKEAPEVEETDEVEVMEDSNGGLPTTAEEGNEAESDSSSEASESESSSESATSSEEGESSSSEGESDGGGDSGGGGE